MQLQISPSGLVWMLSIYYIWNPISQEDCPLVRRLKKERETRYSTCMDQHAISNYHPQHVNVKLHLQHGFHYQMPGLEQYRASSLCEVLWDTWLAPFGDTTRLNSTLVWLAWTVLISVSFTCATSTINKEQHEECTSMHFVLKIWKKKWSTWEED